MLIILLQVVDYKPIVDYKAKVDYFCRTDELVSMFDHMVEVWPLKPQKMELLKNSAFHRTSCGFSATIIIEANRNKFGIKELTRTGKVHMVFE
ncbi:hypothetical protein L6452_38583 [Arctium lappa]|uniref:Uncharacterized protein n=1 Tax=Arctium lappa TaxID=4217 RepID=A0ACB8XQ66_ARCLA|nr:hypothetical protein L6452_38583 [Arctium lappa]